mmetsp:Transcript_36622/g.121286  ORF Transcript_36622/g.121286 Transcript_36622/m.121286 type:complete len:293 (-) Transcript_36622:114-992(-)
MLRQGDGMRAIPPLRRRLWPPRRCILGLPSLLCDAGLYFCRLLALPGGGAQPAAAARVATARASTAADAGAIARCAATSDGGFDGRPGGERATETAGAATEEEEERLRGRHAWTERRGLGGRARGARGRRRRRLWQRPQAAAADCAGGALVPASHLCERRHFRLHAAAERPLHRLALRRDHDGPVRDEHNAVGRPHRALARPRAGAGPSVPLPGQPQSQHRAQEACAQGAAPFPRVGVPVRVSRGALLLAASSLPHFDVLRLGHAATARLAAGTRLHRKVPRRVPRLVQPRS